MPEPLSWAGACPSLRRRIQHVQTDDGQADSAADLLAGDSVACTRILGAGRRVGAVSWHAAVAGPVGDSTRWQYQVIEFVRGYERQMGYHSHPIGMTMQFPVPDQTRVNDPLFHGPADWVSPGFDDVAHPGGAQRSRWFTDPPANDGTKVVLTDTDHYAAGAGDALWAWKSFLRGHHPILMDFGIIDVASPLDTSHGGALL